MRAILMLFVFSLAAFARREPLVFDIKWVNPPKDPPCGVTHHVFPSAAMKTDVGFNIYLPPEYASSPGKRFSVIYWVHVAGGRELKYPEMFGSVLAIAGAYGRIRLDGYLFWAWRRISRSG